MQSNKSLPSASVFKGLVRELLGLDPAALAAMDPKKVSVAAGFHELLRLTLEQALGALWAEEGSKFQLHSKTSSKALRSVGWGDARNFNLSALFAHSLLGTPRRVRGRSYIPLCPADERVVNLPQKRQLIDDTPMAGLVAMVVDLFEVDIHSPGPGSLQPISICALVKETLGLSPAAVVGPCFDNESHEVEQALARDTEWQTSVAFAALLMTALKVYQRIIAQEDVGFVRLLIVDEEYPNGRYSNIINLLVAGLLADGERDVAFIIAGSST